VGRHPIPPRDSYVLRAFGDQSHLLDTGNEAQFDGSAKDMSVGGIGSATVMSGAD